MKYDLSAIPFRKVRILTSFIMMIMLIGSMYGIMKGWLEFDITVLVMLGALTGTLTVFKLLEPESASEEIKVLRHERESITQQLSQEKGDIFQTIQLSLNQIIEYYTINKAQAKKSFSYSLFAIVVGLLTLLIGIGMLYYNSSRGLQSDMGVSWLTSISGVLLEFIGGAYFFMYKKSVEQVNYFFSQLVKIQDTMLAITLAKDLKEENAVKDMQEKIITSLLERSLK